MRAERDNESTINVALFIVAIYLVDSAYPRSAPYSRRRSHRAPIAVEINGIAAYRPPRNQSVEVVGGPRSILITVLAPAELSGLGRIDTPEPNARAVDLQRITIGARRSGGHGFAILRVCDVRKTRQQDCDDTCGPMCHAASKYRIIGPYRPKLDFRSYVGC
jgi:hypothetical protein